MYFSVPPPQDEKKSRHRSSLHGRKNNPMDSGIRLRSDSNGSMKSAFYQGTIVSAPVHQPKRNVADTGGDDAAGYPAIRPRRRPTSRQISSVHKARRPSPLSVTDDMLSSSLEDVDFFGTSLEGDINMSRPSAAVSVPRGVSTVRSNSAVERPSMIDAGFGGRNTVPTQRDSRILGIDLLENVQKSSYDSNEAPGSGEQSRLSINSAFSHSSGAFLHHPLHSGPLRGSFPIQESAHTTYGTNGKQPLSGVIDAKVPSESTVKKHYSTVEEGDEDQDEDSQPPKETFTYTEWIMDMVDDWLLTGVEFDNDGSPYFRESSKWTLPGIVRSVFFNPIYPEFTSLQQFCWAVIIGIVMGVYTAGWKMLIEACVDFMWKDVPETLLEWGIFSELDGNFPIYHYVWIVPAIFGGLLSYIFAALPTPIPGQNEWIHNLHSRGVQESDTFVMLFILSTAGMASGLSLGPELPLILTSGMFGSWLGVLCKQSMLQARVLNLTAASAAIGGFFGFPMAGALFVLEVPHRMGLQYFEALSPATIASIVAVLANRLVTGNDVTGYFEYPFLNSSLPSEIFTNAIFYGLFGAALGIFYTKVVLELKHAVHDMFHKHDSHDVDAHDDHHKLSSIAEESVPLVGDPVLKMKPKHPKSIWETLHALTSCVIPHEPTRAGVSGMLVGIVVGITGMFIPHVMFWGEAQLQNLIDKGRTPLPVFGHGDAPTAGMISLGYCIIDHNDPTMVNEGFSLGCAAAITLAKIFVTGLSLGTGIIGGHFWGPLFAGCAASHFLTDLVQIVSDGLGLRTSLASYPCVAILCIMGSTHVVTFRAHTAIILILTLTIDAFDPEGNVSGELKVAGDYSAVFPLLTVSVFVALQISRQIVFYEKQRSRGDIMALPEVLCEPGKEGTPLVMDYDGNLHELDDSEPEYESEPEDDIAEVAEDSYRSIDGVSFRSIDGGTTQRDIEAQFEATKLAKPAPPSEGFPSKPTQDPNAQLRRKNSSSDGSAGRTPNPFPPRPPDSKPPRTPSQEDKKSFGDSRLDELLAAPLETSNTTKMHRRSTSAPLAIEGAGQMNNNIMNRGDLQKSTEAKPGSPGPPGHRRKLSGSGSLVRVTSFGQVDQEQPSLLDQARLRASSFASSDKARQRLQKQKSFSLSPSNMPPRGGRVRISSFDAISPRVSAGCPLSPDDVDRTFAAGLINDTSPESGRRSPWTANSN